MNINDSVVSRLIAVATLFSVAALLFMLTATSPQDVGPLGLLFVFVFGYLTIVGLMTIALFYLSKLFRLILPARRRLTIRELTLARAYVYSLFIAMLPTMLVGLYSVGDIAWYDIALLVTFVVIGLFYITRRI